jgi:DNA-binding MarR family transcriptional regulator
MTVYAQPGTRTVGYLVRALDDALDEVLACTLGGFGLTRLDWQVLTVLRDERLGPAGSVSVLDLQREMLADPYAVSETLAGLRVRGWLTPTFAVTESGERLYQRAAVKVDAVGAGLVAGLAPDECAQAARVLELMLDNLDRL